jgi:hypothetical protein
MLAAWFPFGFRLVLLVLACWFLFGSLAVRSSGPVLDGVDGVLDAWFACLVCLDSFVGSFGEERLAYIYGRTLYIDFLSSRSNSPSLSLYTFAFASASTVEPSTVEPSRLNPPPASTIRYGLWSRPCLSLPLSPSLSLSLPLSPSLSLSLSIPLASFLTYYTLLKHNPALRRKVFTSPISRTRLVSPPLTQPGARPEQFHLSSK